MGLDPGFAKTGYAILRWTDAIGYELIHGACLRTKPCTSRAQMKRLNIRAVDDDLNRYQVLSSNFESILAKYKPDVVGIESMVLSVHRSGGSFTNSGASKVLAVYGAAVALAHIREIPTYASVPGAQQRYLLRKRKGDKRAVQAGLCSVHPAISAQIEKLPVYAQEHVTDAVVHGMIAGDKYRECRKT